MEDTRAPMTSGGDAVAKVKTQADHELRGQAVASVYKFLSGEGVIDQLEGKLRDTQLPLEAEMGRNAAMMAERVVEKAKDKGIELPQSAIWVIPSQEEGARGVVTAAIEAQANLAKEAGILSEEQYKETSHKALMHAAKEGMRAPGIAQGAQATGEIFKSMNKGESSKTQGAAHSALKALRGGKYH